MDGTQDEYMTPEMMDELEVMQQEQAENGAEDNFMMNQELMDAYGSPQPQELQNQHSFLHKAAFGSDDTVRTTFLHEHELGRPLFSVRFLMDMEDVAHYYLDPIMIELGMDPKDNAIANYFGEKLQNITSSGMSNKGFSMNLNVTRKMDATRKRMREGDAIENLKGGGNK